MRATAIMTMARVAMLMAAMMPITTVTMGRALPISALAAVGMTIIIIPVTGFPSSTKSGAATRCATITAVIGAKSGNFTTESTAGATVTAGATTAASAATPMMRRRA